MDGNKLSKRLLTVAKYVKSNSRVADIGSDHAYLPIHLAKQGKLSFGVAGEVAMGPLSNAEHEIKMAGLNSIIMPRLADGLAAINASDEINTITIAGMGGALITKILEQGRAKLKHAPELVLQPNVDAVNIRKWLMANHYQIMNEDILKEDRHIYEIIHATYVNKPVNYTDNELLFGPFLINKQNDVFIEKWRDKIKRLQKAIQQMQTAKVPPLKRINGLQTEIDLIEEVLKHARH